MDAVKTGRWSDPETWGGKIPPRTAVARAAGHVVTIDQDVSVRRLAADGGYFVTEGDVTITTAEPARPDGDPGSYVLGIGGGDVVLHGDVAGGERQLQHSVLLSGGRLTIRGDLTGGRSPAVWQVGGTLEVHGTLSPGHVEAIRSEGGELLLDATIILAGVPAFVGVTPTLIDGEHLAVVGPGEEKPVLMSAGRKLPAKVQGWPPRRTR